VGLKLRLIIVLMIPPILMVGVYGLIRVRIGRAELIDDNERTVVVVAKAVQVAVERALRDPRTSDLRGMLTDIVRDQEQIDRLRIFDRSLQPTLVSNRLGIGDDVATDVLRRVTDTGRAEAFSRQRGREPVFYYVVPLRAEGGTIVGTMEAAHLLSGIERRVGAATWDIAIRLGLLVVSLTLLTGVVLQREVLRPLFGLMEGIQSLGRGSPTRPLPVERRDEIGRLAEAFNAMTRQLQAARHDLVLETERTLDLEQQVRHSATLAVAGRLASGLAHEVGTPLNIISGRAEYLLQNLPEGDERHDDLNVIVEQIDRISAMIRSLLDMVRPVKPDIQPTQVKSVVARLLPLLEHAARRHGVKLEVELPDALPSIEADRNQLQQVLINVLMNAFEAAGPVGHVRLVAGPAVRGSRGGIEIRVTDSGPGIPAALLPRIFEPFFSTKPPGEGTGLGLPICRDIVRSLAGDIILESTPATGTTVRVWLPTAHAA
jgi:two-component system, NtrC family, sensor kinase